LPASSDGEEIAGLDLIPAVEAMQATLGDALPPAA
jgi:hypothetical protein